MMLSNIRDFLWRKKQVAKVMTQRVNKSVANKPVGLGIMIVAKSYNEVGEDFTIGQFIKKIRENMKMAKQDPEKFALDFKKAQKNNPLKLK